VVNQGIFSIETTSTVGAGGTITYNASTSAQFFQNASPSTVTRPMIFNGSGIQVGNAGGNPATIGSPMTMQGDVTFTNLNNSTGSLRLTGAIGEAGGARSLTKTGADHALPRRLNTYTGATLVNAGVVVVNGSLAAGSAVTVNGATATSAALGGGVGTVEGVVNGPVTVTRGLPLARLQRRYPGPSQQTSARPRRRSTSASSASEASTPLAQKQRSTWTSPAPATPPAAAPAPRTTSSSSPAHRSSTPTARRCS
jgi:hypothetical protein